MSDSPMLTRDPLHAVPRVWGEPCEIAPDVFMHPAFVNTYALRTPAGLLLVDPGFGHAVGQRARGRARLERRAAAHRGLHARPRRPRLRPARRSSPPASGRRSSRRRTAWRAFAATGSRTAGTRASTSASSACRSPSFPTTSTGRRSPFATRCAQRLGDLDVHYRAAKGETDDACWVWVPERALPLHRRSDHLAGAELRQPAEGAALPGGVGRRARRHGRPRRRVALPRPRPRGAGARGGAPGAHRDRALSARHHRPGARAHERRADAGGDLPRRRARPRAGDASVPARPTTTIRSSSCATCCACGAAGGTATPPICCRRPGRRRPARSPRSPAASTRWSRAAARCSTPATATLAAHLRRVGDARRARRSRRAAAQARRLRSAA